MTALIVLVIIVAVSLGLSAIMSGAWLAWRSTRNSGWIDTTWTFGLGAVGCLRAFTPTLMTGAVTIRQVLVAVLVAVWSLRLGLHIARRTLRIKDDPRYGKMIAEWGADSSRQMFFLAQKQALVSIPLALSIVLAAWNPWPVLRLQDALGVLVLIVAIAGEGLADTQLRRFRADPANRNRICDVGLWGWSRHPNYFFEWLGWLAYPVIAISPDYPWGWATLLAPVFMYWILVYATGIPPLEAQMLRSRGERYRGYQARTSIFFPLPPRGQGPKGELE